MKTVLLSAILLLSLGARAQINSGDPQLDNFDIRNVEGQEDQEQAQVYGPQIEEMDVDISRLTREEVRSRYALPILPEGFEHDPDARRTECREGWKLIRPKRESSTIRSIAGPSLREILNDNRRSDIRGAVQHTFCFRP